MSLWKFWKSFEKSNKKYEKLKFSLGNRELVPVYLKHKKGKETMHQRSNFINCAAYFKFTPTLTLLEVAIPLKNKLNLRTIFSNNMT